MRVVDQSLPVRSGAAARTLTAQDVRQLEIILKRPRQRAVFHMGVVGAAVLGFAAYG